MGKGHAASTIRRCAAVLVLVAGVVVGAVVAAAPGITSIDSGAVASRPGVRGQRFSYGPPDTARYRVTLVQEWSPATHPATVPRGWHTSPAVLVAHHLPGDTFAVGGFASRGIELMAETGATSTLRSELAARVTVGEVDTGRGIDRTGTDTLEVAVNQGRGYLSLVTMLAPSPDWFVGFSAVPVFLGDAWAERIVLDLQPFDAGTDSGVDFTSGDVDTQPRQRVSGPRDSGYLAAAAEGRFGYVVIERIG